MLNLVISLSADTGNRAVRKIGGGGGHGDDTCGTRVGAATEYTNRHITSGSRMSYAKRSGRSGAPVGIATALVFTVSGIGTAYGDEAADESIPALQEVTVTATRQSQPLSKVPVSVAV